MPPRAATPWQNIHSCRNSTAPSVTAFELPANGLRVLVVVAGCGACPARLSVKPPMSPTASAARIDVVATAIKKDFIVALYLASGFGRTWNFTTFGLAPLPPSWCQGVYIE